MNIPNSLSLFRILLVPVIVFLMFSYQIGGNTDHFLNLINTDFFIEKINLKLPLAWIIALVLFIIASTTDFVDGYIARKYNLVTDLGKFLDPIADKILVTSVLIVLSVAGIVPGWVLIIIVSRDLIVGVIREIGAKKQVAIAADKLGKIKTTLQMIAIVILMFINGKFLSLPSSSWQSQVCLIPIYIACLLTIISMINYIIKNWGLLFKDSKGEINMENEFTCCKCNTKTDDIVFYYAYAKPESKKEDDDVMKFCQDCYKKWLNK